MIDSPPQQGGSGWGAANLRGVAMTYKLSHRQVEVVVLVGGGLSQTETARTLGVTRQRVSLILSRLSEVLPPAECSSCEYSGPFTNVIDHVLASHPDDLARAVKGLDRDFHAVEVTRAPEHEHQIGRRTLYDQARTRIREESLRNQPPTSIRP